MNARIAFALALLLVGACSSDGEDGTTGDPPANGEVIIPETTKVLSSATLDAAEMVSEDLSEIRFSSLSGVEPGDVIVADVHSSFPFGMLRRVESMTEEGGSVILTTSQAKLTDAIERGALSENFQLAPQSGSSSGGLKRAELRSAQSDDPEVSFFFGINDYELYDADKDSSTKGDRVSLDGTVSFSPEVSIEIDIDGFELDTFLFQIGAVQQSSLRITAGREANFDKSWTIDSIELPPISLAIGPVPVVLIPRIDIMVGIDGTVSAELTAGATADNTAIVGFGYQNGSWDPVSDISADGGFDVPAFREGARAGFKVWAGPKVSVSAYGIAGLYGQLHAFLRAEVDAKLDPWWSIYAGLDASAGAFVELFGATIAEYETDPATVESQIGAAEGPAPVGGAEVITWAHLFSGDSTDVPHVVITTDDGGSLVAGQTSSFTGSSPDAWLIKLDALGEVSWQRAAEDTRGSSALIQKSDSHYMLGLGTSLASGAGFGIAELDENGDTLWARTLTGTTGLGLCGIVENGDGYMIAGTIDDGIGADVFFAGLDSAGDVIWSRRIGGASQDTCRTFTESNGQFIAAAVTSSFGVTNSASWAVAIDSQGSVLWQRVYDRSVSGNERAAQLVTTSEGKLKLVAHDGDALVLSLGTNGVLESSLRYDTGSPYEEVVSAVAMRDGGLALAGKRGLAAEADTWIVRLNAAGEVVWVTTFGGPMGEEAGAITGEALSSSALALDEDDGLIVASNAEADRFWDLWVAKVAASGAIQFDDASYTATNHAGTFEDALIEDAATSAVAAEFTLMSEPLELPWYSTTAAVSTQASP